MQSATIIHKNGLTNKAIANLDSVVWCHSHMEVSVNL
jgi:hypothetical protein